MAKVGYQAYCEYQMQLLKDVDGEELIYILSNTLRSKRRFPSRGGEDRGLKTPFKFVFSFLLFRLIYMFSFVMLLLHLFCFFCLCFVFSIRRPVFFCREQKEQNKVAEICFLTEAEIYPTRDSTFLSWGKTIYLTGVVLHIVWG